jgi:hypothetical protein
MFMSFKYSVETKYVVHLTKLSLQTSQYSMLTIALQCKDLMKLEQKKLIHH